MATAVVNSIDRKEQKVKNVFRTIMMQDVPGWQMSMAQSYAREGLKMESDDLLMQIPYMLTNLQYWRGDEARRCKKVLKEFGGVRWIK